MACHQCNYLKRQLRIVKEENQISKSNRQQVLKELEKVIKNREKYTSEILSAESSNFINKFLDSQTIIQEDHEERIDSLNVSFASRLSLLSPVDGSVSLSSQSCCDAEVRSIKNKLSNLLEVKCCCCICGDLFVNATITRCNHVFCSTCILKHCENNNVNCPLCRATLKIDKHRKVEIVDELITGLTKLISDAKFAARLQLIEDRANDE